MPKVPSFGISERDQRTTLLSMLDSSKKQFHHLDGVYLNAVKQ